MGDKEIQETILEEAARITAGDRKNSYGPPELDFERTAALWNALFVEKLTAQFDAADVARAMICLKLSRSMWMDKRDNPVDIAGYAACLHRCDTGEW